jgi:bifunctional non-homologous end joining protein LigD
MLEHLADRPLTLERYPRGIESNGFMQKNAAPGFPEFIGRVEVGKAEGTVTHPLVRDAAGLAYLANQNTIAFHIWTSRLPELGRPDRLVLDLDPSPDRIEDGRTGAGVVGDLLGDLGMAAGLLATGSTGYHLTVPLRARHDFSVVERCSRLLAGLATRMRPDLLTTEFLKRERGGRVFVDWLRNRWAQSVISPWSLRPRRKAPVATPIAWEELSSTDPGWWTLRTVGVRFDSPSPWPPPQELPVEAIEGAAAAAGVSAEEPFDRFGRR